MSSLPITYCVDADFSADTGSLVKPSRKARSLLLVIAGAAVVLFGSAAIARSMDWLPAPDGSAADIRAGGLGDAAAATEAAVRPPGRLRRKPRCAGCGSIVSSREIEDSVDAGGPYGVSQLQAKKTYAFTIRLSDGSRRIVTDTNPAAWRIGERVNIIDGEIPPHK